MDSNENRAESCLGPYPFDWTDLEDFNYPKDGNGLPLVEVVGYSGLHHNPITIAQFGLYNLQRFTQTNDTEFWDKARICIQWFADNFREWRKDVGAWVYEFGLYFYGPEAPWISGMAQAQAISLLLRGYQVEPDQKWLALTRKAFNAFLRTVEDGGVVAHFQDGTPVFEEFTTLPPSLVLNGHMFALLGLYDYMKFWNAPEARDLFEQATAGLLRNLPLYDTGFWNLYDLHPSRRLASPMYVIVHIRLLHVLADMTGETGFRDFADKWSAYHRSKFCRVRWLASKAWEKLRLRL